MATSESQLAPGPQFLHLQSRQGGDGRRQINAIAYSQALPTSDPIAPRDKDRIDLGVGTEVAAPQVLIGFGDGDDVPQVLVAESRITVGHHA